MLRTNAETRPSSPRSSRISSTTARYSRSRLRVRPSTGVGRALIDLDEQPSVGHRLSGAGDAAVEPLKGDGACPTGQANLLGDLGDRADDAKSCS